MREERRGADTSSVHSAVKSICLLLNPRAPLATVACVFVARAPGREQRTRTLLAGEAFSVRVCALSAPRAVRVCGVRVKYRE